ncbi:MAG: hypothetical protein IJF07_03055, partial [Lachnospiraceae bacterium]|nr:hypothetical protein [Lachnospiraceae bacterium]
GFEMLNTASASITLFGQDLYKKILNAIDQYTPYKLTYGNPIAQGFQNHADDIRYLDTKDPDIIEEIITDMGSQTGKTAAEIQEMTEEAIEQAVRKVDEVGSTDCTELKEVFHSIKESPNYPEGFQARVNGTTSNKVNNYQLLEKLREIESGTWKKIYKDGYDTYGNEISIHYFQSQSGKVFDVKVKTGWSN